MEAVLPIVAVGDDGELEWVAVQEDELNVTDGVHLLDVVAQLDVLRDRLVKVGDSRVLSPPATEEGLFLCRPDDLETGEEGKNRDRSYREPVTPNGRNGKLAELLLNSKLTKTIDS